MMKKAYGDDKDNGCSSEYSVKPAAGVGRFRPHGASFPGRLGEGVHRVLGGHRVEPRIR